MYLVLSARVDEGLATELHDCDLHLHQGTLRVRSCEGDLVEKLGSVQLKYSETI